MRRKVCTGLWSSQRGGGLAAPRPQILPCDVGAETQQTSHLCQVSSCQVLSIGAPDRSQKTGAKEKETTSVLPAFPRQRGISPMSAGGSNLFWQNQLHLDPVELPAMAASGPTPLSGLRPSSGRKGVGWGVSSMLPGSNNPNLFPLFLCFSHPRGGGYTLELLTLCIFSIRFLPSQLSNTMYQKFSYIKSILLKPLVQILFS